MTGSDKDELLLQIMLEAMAPTAKHDFFDTCMEKLASALSVKCTFISAPVAERPAWNRVLSHWPNHNHAIHTEYRVAGTPCSVARTNDVAVFVQGVQEEFPEDPRLKAVGAESYVALQLPGRDDKPLGHFGFIHDAPYQPSDSEIRRLKLIAAGIASRLEQLQVELEMQRHIDLREKVFASGPFGVTHWDLVSGEAWGNQAFTDIVGRDYENARAVGWGQVIHPEDLERFTSASNRLVTLGKTFDEVVRIRRPDGEQRWVQIHAVAALDESGTPLQTIGLIVDQTVAQTAKEQLRAAVEELDLRNAELESSLNAFPDLRFKLSANGTYLSVWTSDPSKLIIPAPDIVGSNISDHFHGPLADRIRAAIRQTIESSQVSVVSYTLDQDGQRAHYEARLARLGSNEVMAVVRDVTDLKTLEQQLVHAETMQSIGRLAGGVAHDFNNVLHIIRGHASALERQVHNPESSRHRLDAIMRAVDRSTSLVDRLMAMSRPLDDNPVATEVDSFMRGLGPSLRQLVGEQIALAFDLKAPEAAVIIDDSRFENVVFNMVTNARDAMPLGGTVTITTRPTDNNMVTIKISDTGSGMDSQAQARVFEPFFTTKSPGVGTGLGLATAYTTITSAGGQILIESAPGEGTTVLIRLPLTDQTSEEPVLTHPDSGVHSRSTATVLVVEDELDVLDLCADALRNIGCRVFEANSGKTALDVFDRETIDLVLTDVVMPNMTGPDLAERLFVRNPDVPVVYMSGYAAQTITDRSGITPEQILRKPFTNEQLERTLAERLVERLANKGAQ